MLQYIMAPEFEIAPEDDVDDDLWAEEHPTIDELVEGLRRLPRGGLDSNSRYDQAYLAFRDRCLDLWDQGVLPRGDERHLWSEKHDEIMDNLLEQVCREFKLDNYAPMDFGE